MSRLGHPRLHLRRTDSTNERARALAVAGAPSGTLVTAAEQTAGRGRQGRTWWAPAGSSLLLSLVIREPPNLLPLIAGVAVCDAAGESAAVKWPNDIVIRRESGRQEADPRAPELAKLAGILVEGRVQEGWAVLGIGANVAVRVERLPADVRDTAASLERAPSDVEALLAQVLRALERRLAQPVAEVLAAWRARDALLGRAVAWQGGHGTAQGVDERGRLLVLLPDGASEALSAGEVHLRRVS